MADKVSPVLGGIYTLVSTYKLPSGHVDNSWCDTVWKVTKINETHAQLARAENKPYHSDHMPLVIIANYDWTPAHHFLEQ